VYLDFFPRTKISFQSSQTMSGHTKSASFSHLHPPSPSHPQPMDYSFYGSWYNLEKIILSTDPLFKSTILTTSYSSYKLCHMCYDNTQSLLNSHQCEYAICDSCLLRYLRVLISGEVMKRNQTHDILCYCGYCQLIISETTILRLLSSDQKLMRKYFRYKKNLLVKFNSNYCWCPAPGCETILKKGNEGKRMVCSTCQFEFCHTCRLGYLSPDHENIPCAEVC
jgi:hypothetical protein